MRLWIAFVPALAVAGCSFDDVDLDGKRCPCAVGWVCDDSINRCVEELFPDAGFDGGRDAGDAGRDAGPRDGGRDAGADAGAGAGMDAGVDAGMDAGTDAGRDAGTDAGLDPTACDDVHAGALFCNGYELSHRSEWDSMASHDGYFAFPMRPYPVYRGDYSFHAHVDLDTGYALMRSYAPGTVSSTDWYVRAYLYIPSGFTVNGIDVLHLQEGSEYRFVQLGIGGDALQVYTDVPSTGPEVVYGSAFPRDEWVCIELHVQVGDPGVVEFWMNDTLDGYDGSIDTQAAAPYDTLIAGVVYNEAGETETILTYLDEVVIDTSRIGCD